MHRWKTESQGFQWVQKASKLDACRSSYGQIELSSKIDREVSHSSLYSAPDFIVAGPKENNQNISISATSLSDITGIPRATCIRKLNQMVIRKLVTQDEDTKRYHIIPEALAKSLVSKNLTSKVTELFSEFYFIVIKALSIKTTH